MESQIRNGDLLLRFWAVTDAAAVDDIVTSSKMDFDTWLPGLTRELARFKEYVDGRAQSATDGSGWYYCIELGNDIVGECSIEVRERQTGEIGYWIRSDRTQVGIATRAVRAMFGPAAVHGFETLDIRCDEGNVRSAAVARRAGFTHVATATLDVSVVEADSRTGREMTWRLALNARPLVGP